jgi:hypothetical protein
MAYHEEYKQNPKYLAYLDLMREKGERQDSVEQEHRLVIKY